MTTRLTRNQLYVLKCLADGVRDFASRYTISLRLLEERGLAAFAIGPQRWRITPAGRQALPD